MDAKVTPTQEPLDFDREDPHRIAVNGHCTIDERDGIRVVSVLGVPIHRYPANDRAAEALFIAQAIEVGYATPAELAPAVQSSERTIYRIRERYEKEGAIGLLQERRGRPRGQTLGKARELVIRQWHAEVELEQPQELRKPVPASDRDLARIAASYRGSARSRGCTYC